MMIRQHEKIIMNSIDNQISHGVVPYMTSVFSSKVKSFKQESAIQPMFKKSVAFLLPAKVYYPATLILFVMNVACAIFVPDIEVLIGFIGSISNTTLNAVFPGLFFIIVSKKNMRLQASRLDLALASCLAIYGLIIFVIGTSMRVISLVKD